MSEKRLDTLHGSIVDANFPFEAGYSDAQIIESISELMTWSIADTYAHLNRLAKAGSIIDCAREVRVFCISPHFCIAGLFCSELVTIGKSAGVAPDGEQGILARTLGPHDCGIVISYSGNNANSRSMRYVPALLEIKVPDLCALAVRGYVVATVDHRNCIEDAAPAPAFLQDVKCASRFLRAHADQYGIDSSRVAIWGTSSGAHAAQMVGVSGDLPEFETQEWGGESDAVQAVVSCFGPSDMVRWMQVMGPTEDFAPLRDRGSRHSYRYRRQQCRAAEER